MRGAEGPKVQGFGESPIERKPETLGWVRARVFAGRGRQGAEAWRGGVKRCRRTPPRAGQAQAVGVGALVVVEPNGSLDVEL